MILCVSQKEIVSLQLDFLEVLYELLKASN